MDTCSHARLGEARNLTMVVYGLQLAGILIILTPLIGVMLNHIKRRDVASTLYASHFDWQIRTFWWSVLWSAIGLALVPLFGLGALVIAAAGIWFLYRAVRGMLAWHQHEPMPTRARALVENHG